MPMEFAAQSDARAVASGPRPRPLLVIDTATRPGFVGVWQPSSWMAFEAFPDARRQSEDVFPAIGRVLEAAQVTLDALGGIAVAQGPGSFSALRVGLCAAKSLAETGKIPLVGISVLDAAAETAGGVLRGVLAAASRDQVFFAIYEERGSLAAGPVVAALDAAPWPAGSTPAALVAVDDKVAGLLATTALPFPTPPIVVAGDRLPALLAEQAWRRLEMGRSDDPLLLDALYVRPQDAGGAWTDLHASSHVDPG